MFKLIKQIFSSSKEENKQIIFSSYQVANYFLDIAKEEGFPINYMKLSKLVYYAHGWYLANYDKPLLDSDIEAAFFGVHIPSLYNNFKKFGNEPVIEFAKVSNTTPRIPKSNEEVRRFLKLVWDIHKNYTGIQLSNDSHKEGSPWEILKNQGITFPVSIDNDSIKKYFKEYKFNNSSSKSEIEEEAKIVRLILPKDYVITKEAHNKIWEYIQTGNNPKPKYIIFSVRKFKKLIKEYKEQGYNLDEDQEKKMHYKVSFSIPNSVSEVKEIKLEIIIVPGNFGISIVGYPGNYLEEGKQVER